MSEYNDNELLYLLSENEDFAFELLMEKYEPLIINRLRRFHIKKEYWDDYYQECIILLYKCATNYREDITKTFNKYFDRLLQYNIQNLLRKDKNGFYKVINMSTDEIDSITKYHLDEVNELKPMSFENDMNSIIIKMMHSGSTIKEIAETNKLNYYQAYNLVRQHRRDKRENNPLSRFEYSIYELYTSGYRPKEIGSLLGIETRKVYYALKRIRSKQKIHQKKQENKNY